MIIEAKGINADQLEKESVELSYNDIYFEDIKSILSERKNQILRKACEGIGRKYQDYR